jgi:hypothetical protein
VRNPAGQPRCRGPGPPPPTRKAFRRRPWTCTCRRSPSSPWPGRSAGVAAGRETVDPSELSAAGGHRSSFTVMGRSGRLGP